MIALLQRRVFFYSNKKNSVDKRWIFSSTRKRTSLWSDRQKMQFLFKALLKKKRGMEIRHATLFGGLYTFFFLAKRKLFQKARPLRLRPFHMRRGSIQNMLSTLMLISLPCRVMMDEKLLLNSEGFFHYAIFIQNQTGLNQRKASCVVCCS